MPHQDFNVQIRLTYFARFVLNATLMLMSLTGIKLGQSWMKSFLSRSWVMRIGNSKWVPLIVDDEGRFRCARA